jgi:hypothetical protein
MLSKLVRFAAVISVVVAGLVTLPSTALALTQDPDTSTWMANGKVLASARYGNVMFIGGTFKKLQESLDPGPAVGQAITGLTGLAAIDMTTGAGISSFTPEIGAVGSQQVSVDALAMVGDTLYVGGQFGTVDGQPRMNLAAIDIDPGSLTGTVDPVFDPFVGTEGGNLANFRVLSILTDTDSLYISGGFSKVDGKGRNKIAKLSYDGVVDPAFRPAATNGAVRDLAWSIDRGTIFAGGNFTTLSGAPRLAIGRVDAATGAPNAWAVPTGDIPSSGGQQICWDILVTTTRLFAGCGKGPNFVGAFRVDNGTTGSRTWQYRTGGNVNTVALMPGGDGLVFGGHFGINSTTTYNGLMPVCSPTRYLRAVGILRNINQTSIAPVVTNGLPSATTAYLDCSFTPNYEGTQPQGPNYEGTNKHGGVWDVLVTDEHIWALGEQKYINNTVRRAIARFPL